MTLALERVWCSQQGTPGHPPDDLISYWPLDLAGILPPPHGEGGGVSHSLSLVLLDFIAPDIIK